ncbi:MAG: SET domain-containing protein-lysine N-methyltransferase [Actinobacteria bacterium]|nr:SET domain-containing protein-lysine N-methyltransferase [Actinomycetota bacterium]
MKHDLDVVSIPRKGRGLVAGRRFRSGEVIDRAPVLVIPAAEWGQIQGTCVGRLCFSWGRNGQDGALALGPVSLLNHSYTPNAFAQAIPAERMMEFLALRDIPRGEEITINYNGDPDAADRVDFRVYK